MNDYDNQLAIDIKILANAMDHIACQVIPKMSKIVESENLETQFVSGTFMIFSVVF